MATRLASLPCSLESAIVFGKFGVFGGYIVPPDLINCGRVEGQGKQKCPSVGQASTGNQPPPTRLGKKDSICFLQALQARHSLTLTVHRFCKCLRLSDTDRLEVTDESARQSSRKLFPMGSAPPCSALKRTKGRAFNYYLSCPTTFALGRFSFPASFVATHLPPYDRARWATIFHP